MQYLLGRICWTWPLTWARKPMIGIHQNVCTNANNTCWFLCMPTMCSWPDFSISWTCWIACVHCAIQNMCLSNLRHVAELAKYTSLDQNCHVCTCNCAVLRIFQTNSKVLTPVLRLGCGQSINQHNFQSKTDKQGLDFWGTWLVNMLQAHATFHSTEKSHSVLV